MTEIVMNKKIFIDRISLIGNDSFYSQIVLSESEVTASVKISFNVPMRNVDVKIPQWCLFAMRRVLRYFHGF